MMVAGLQQPDTGTIALNGASVAELPPYRRDIGMVFQNYALFPHMTVRRNVAFPLEMRRLGRAEIARLVDEALQLVKLPDHGDRLPRQLSGGQQQRVALARAMVYRPALLLMDEPLGALDRKLREQLQLEIKRVHRERGISVLYVTHDQEEALTMSDRIAVMNLGRIEQVGTPAEVYEQPSTSFVAGFVGVSNVLSGDAAKAITGSPQAFTIRPEKIRMEGPDARVAPDEWSATGRVHDVVYLGAYTRYVVELDVGGRLVVTQQNLTTSSMEALQVRGRAVRLVWDRQLNRPVEGDERTDPAEGGG